MNDCFFNYFKNDIELRCNCWNMYYIFKFVYVKFIVMMIYVCFFVVFIDYVYILDLDGFFVIIN